MKVVQQTKTIQTLVTLIALTFLMSACQKKIEKISSDSSSYEVLTKNLVTLTQAPTIEKTIGDESTQVTVLNTAAVENKLSTKEFVKITDAYNLSLLNVSSTNLFNNYFNDKSKKLKSTVGGPVQKLLPAPPTLKVSIPMQLLGEQNIFGGVITKVSAADNENLGMLKLTDIPPMHVQTKLINDSATNSFYLGLAGCVFECSENNPNNNEPIIAFPISALDAVNNALVIDFSNLGNDLDIMALIDPSGSSTNLKTKYAKTVAVDFGISTLIVDVESHMEPVKTDLKNPNPAEVVITSRWYLRLSSKFSPSFVARTAAPGVGFFMTERSTENKVQRWSIGDLKNNPIKYYIKNVPAEYQQAFKDAFNLWNETLKPLFNDQAFYKIEFIPAGDKRNDILVPGDIRYNIVEWDLVNKAPYGGLGPSIANQFTGEIFTANVLIQGPTIMDIYRKWYGVNLTANALRDIGRGVEADSLLVKKQKEIEADFKKTHHSVGSLQASVGKSLKFNIHAQEKAYEDELMPKNDFEVVPSGVTFEEYMHGYFIDMLAHELGHNIGLRHNFKGNLGAEGEVPTLGKVSRSVMEYLGRGYRYLDRISDYDVMAVSYGYLGLNPKETSWFCTDEDGVDSSDNNTSAECSKDDATNDPFSFFESRLSKAINLLINRGVDSAPTWTYADVQKDFENAIKGLTHYAFSAENTSNQWTNFFNKLDRPKSKEEVKSYVLNKIKSKICDPTITSEIAAKTLPNDQIATKANVDTFRQNVLKVLKPYAVFTALELKCSDSK